jgi:16S rRNA (cytidine1402-2'-O)-methyltransferase
VEVVPGPSSLTAAIALSGLPLGGFHYDGFVPRKRGERRTRLVGLLREGEAIVFYEAPHRLLETLKDLAELAPERQVVITRELTKVHEEVRRGSAADLLAAFGEEKPRGEFVVIVAPGEEGEAPPLPELAGEVAGLVAEGMVAREAVRAVALRHGVSQRQVYDAWLERKGES